MSAMVAAIRSAHHAVAGVNSCKALIESLSIVLRSSGPLFGLRFRARQGQVPLHNLVGKFGVILAECGELEIVAYTTGSCCPLALMSAASSEADG